MKIIITGANGQLGYDCSRLLIPNHDVYAYSSKQLDITNINDVRAFLKKRNPDIVINCAAYTAVDQCEDDKERCMLVNAKGPGILAEQAEETGAKLIHISTDYVFDGSKSVPEPYTEDDPVAPLSVYGKSKLEGERLIREHTENHLIIRTAWLYGIGSGNFLKTMLRLAISEQRKKIKVVNDQYGSLTWTMRLAQQIQQLLDTKLTGTIHATAEGYSTWYQGAITFLEAMNIDHNIAPCTSRDYPTKAKRPANSILENSRLKEKGLNIMKSWQEDVEEFAATYKQELLQELGKDTKVQVLQTTALSATK